MLQMVHICIYVPYMANEYADGVADEDGPPQGSPRSPQGYILAKIN